MKDSMIGSTWHKWDLHIHSKYSLEDRAKLEIKDIFDKAIENGISVISITDHTNVDGLDEIWTLSNAEVIIEGVKYRYSDLVEFIPGIELKTDKGKKAIHVTVLFPKYILKESGEYRVDKSFLETEFLAKLGVTRMRIREQGNGEYKKGLLLTSVSFEQTSTLVKELNGILIVHGGHKDGGIENGMYHHRTDDPEDLLNSLAPDKEYLMKEHISICELSSWSENNIKSMDFYLNMFGKPSIVASDSHETYEGKRYTWIKGDLNIEGLRQVIFEPKYRIHRGTEAPIEPIHKINKVEIDFDEDTRMNGEPFCLVGKQEFKFSPFYTCLVGGRGTGKSSLLNLIHEKLEPNKNSFFQTYKLNCINESSISKCVKVDDGEEKYVEFFGQNEIEEFASNNEKFTNSIYQRIVKLDTSDILNSETRKIYEYVNEIDAQIQRLILRKDKEDQKSQFTKALNSYQKIRLSFNDKEYIDLNNQLEAFADLLHIIIDSKKRYTQLYSALETVCETNDVLDNPRNEYDTEYNLVLNEIKALLSRNNQFESVNLKEKEIRQASLNAKNKLDEFLSKRGVSIENSRDLAVANEKIAEFGQEIQALDNELNKLTSQIESFQFQPNTKDNYETYLNQMLEELNGRLNGLSEEVKHISLKYQFDEGAARTEICKSFIQQFDSNLRLDIVIELINPTLKEEELDALLNDKVKGKNKTAEKVLAILADPINYQIFSLIKAKYYIDAPKYRRINVIYDGKPIQYSSFGQRCTAALVILLLIGNNPVMIDEPEAHLDSSLIAKYLVDLVKQQKSQRQIIIATHNANFVINGDAELIYILETNDQKRTRVHSTTIENLVLRDKLLMLEGGREAFDNRERKYFKR